MLEESGFHRLADTLLRAVSEAIETQDEAGLVDVEEGEAGLMITLENGKSWALTKHAPSRQLWLASPVSGGLHFEWKDDWILADGRKLLSLLAEELSRSSGVSFRLE